MKKTTKITFVILCLALLLGAIVGIVSSAEEAASTESVKIVSKNIKYGEKMYMLIAVAPAKDGDTLPENIGVKTYDFDGNLVHTTYDLKSEQCGEGENKTFLPCFETYGIAAKEINSTFQYVVVDSNGKELTTRISYSAKQYATDRKAGVGGAPTEKQIKLYDSIIAYGNAADEVFGIDRVVTEDDFAKIYDYEKQTEEWERLENLLTAKTDAASAASFVAALKELYALYEPNGKSDVIAWFAGLYSSTVGGYYYSNSARDNDSVQYPASADPKNAVTYNNILYYETAEGWRPLNYELLPDLESTAQALGFFEYSGMLRTYGGDSLPEAMRNQIINFVLPLQDSKTGNFYHPQWTYTEYNGTATKHLEDDHSSRISRDLGSATGILKRFNTKPTYDAPNGTEGENRRDDTEVTPTSLTMTLSRPSAVAVSYVVAVNDTESVDPRLVSLDKFKEYLATFEDLNNASKRTIYFNSYPVGNLLTALTAEIKARDKELGLSGEGSMMHYLAEWLAKHQNAKTGMWQYEYDENVTYTFDENGVIQNATPVTNYEAVNGLLKISGIFAEAGQIFPHADKALKYAIEAISDTTQIGAVVDIYNPWFAIKNIVRNLREYGNDQTYVDGVVSDLLKNAPAGIIASKDKIKDFQNPDGSFSYGREGASTTSQGVPVAVPQKDGNKEGDVNGTVIAITGLIGNILSALELETLKPSLFGETEYRRYMELLGYDVPLTAPAQVAYEAYMNRKDETAEMRNPLDLTKYEASKLTFAGVADGTNPSTLTGIDTESISATGTAAIKDESVVFTTVSGNGDTLKINCTGSYTTETPNVYIFNADLTISDIGNKTATQLYQLQFRNGGSGIAYMLGIGYEQGFLTVADWSSTGDAATRYVNMIEYALPVGEKINLGMEYCVFDDGSVKIKVFINNELAYVSNNIYNSHIEGHTVHNQLTYLNFYGMSDADSTVTLDNIIFVKDKVDLVDLSVGAR